MKSHSRPLRLAFALVALAFTSLAANAGPLNDLFRNADDLGVGTSGSRLTVSAAGASAENGEPKYTDINGEPIDGVSVWYKWKASANGVVTFDTAGSLFDTLLAVYTGQTVANLTPIAQNDDDPTSSAFTSQVRFPVIKDTVYYIAVVGDAATFGVYNLKWDATTAGLVRFTKKEFKTAEEVPTAVITLERVGSTAGVATVTFSTADSLDFPLQATAGDDYTAVTTTVTFADGMSTPTNPVTIPIIDDFAPAGIEGDESLLLSLSAPNGAVLELEGNAVLTIEDDDDNPINDKLAAATALDLALTSIDGENVGAGSEAGEPVHGGGSGHTIWYKFTAPASGGALLLDTDGSTIDQSVDPLDTVLAVYTPSDPQNPKVSELTLVAANDNASDDDVFSRLGIPVAGNQVYYIAIDSKPNIDPNQEIGQTTLNYSFGAGGLFQFSQPVFSVYEDGGTATITVTRTGGSGTVQIGYSAEEEGSALSGSDFQAVSSTLTFGPNETSKTFPVTILNDTLNEGDETVHLVLKDPPVGVLLGDGATATLVIDDDEDNPVNDNFADATELFGTSGSESGSNVGARFQIGEPAHAGPGGHSIWFKWRAPYSGVVTFDTTDSVDEDSNPLDTLLAAYTGSVVNALTPLAANDDVDGLPTSRISFAVRGGTTYSIAVDSRNGVQGDVNLNWNFGGGGLLQFSDAKYSVNEKAPAGSTSKLVTITVTRTDGTAGQVTVDFAADAGTATDVDDFESTGGTLTFGPGETTKTFTVKVLDDAATEGDETVLLSLSNPDGGALLGDPSFATLVINDDEDDPLNDNFANAQNLAAAGAPAGAVGLSNGSVIGENSGASRETGEPDHAGVHGLRSIWYRWQAPAAGVASFDTAGSVEAGGGTLDTVLAIYTLSSKGALVPVAANDEAGPGSLYSRTTFTAKQGTVYFIAVDAVEETGGEVKLSWGLGGGGLLQFRAPVVLAREGNSAVITIDRIGSTAGAVTVDFATAADAPLSAVAGSDYTASTSTVNFADGVASQTVNVPITVDSAVEGEETFRVTLTNAGGGAILSSNVVSATVVIDDANDDPANDTFAAARSLTGPNGDLTDAKNSGASVEPGEPATEGGHTIWFSWKAPASGLVEFSTAGSGTPTQPLDTILTVFTGSSLTSLLQIASNDDVSVSDFTSRVSFAVTAGVTYSIAVDAVAPIAGSTQLHWSLVTGGSFSFTATKFRTIEGANVEITVQRTGVNVNPASVKYLTVDGTAVAGLDYTATTGTLQFAAGQATKSFTVPITDDALANEGEELFQVKLAVDSDTPGSNLIEPSTATVRIFDNEGNPANDSFAGAVDLVANPTGPWSNIGATTQAGEPLGKSLIGTLGGGRTLWFKWKASSSGLATIDTSGSTGTNGPLDTVLAVFSGTSLADLVLVKDNDEAPGDTQISSVEFQAKSGRTYFIAVDTVGDTAGDIVVNIDLAPPDGDGPLLLATPAFTPKVNFKQSYSYRDDQVSGRGSFSGTFVCPLDQVDLAGLTTSSHFSVSLGSDFSFETDFDAKAANGSASFDLPNSGGTVKLVWNATQLTVTIASTLTSIFPFPDPTFDAGKVAETLDADIEFGGVTGHRTVYVGGSASQSSSDATGITSYSSSIHGNADYKKPSIAISNPKANAIIKADPADPTAPPTVSVTGTAGDDVEISDVVVRVNGGDFSSALITFGGVDEDNLKRATWVFDGLELKPGVNLIEAVVIDASGTTTSATRSVNFKTKSTITLLVDGSGTITPNFKGTELDLDKVYSITAKAAVGWTFQGWSGSVSSTDQKLTFAMQDGMIVRATFIKNPFDSLAGVFNGLARPGAFAPTQTGPFTLTLGAAGSFSGKLTLGVTTPINFSGAFDAKGDAVVVVLRKNQLPVTFRLHADLTTGTEQITGTVSDGTFTASIVSDRSTFDPKTNRPPQEGRYTVILSSNPALSGAGITVGHGFLTMVVNGSGSVSLTGRLPDDTMISFSAQLSKSGVMPIYEPLKNSAPLSGSALFGPTRSAGVAGSLDWLRGGLTYVPLGFRGESYDFKKGDTVLPPGALPTSLAGGGYNAETTKTVTLMVDNKVVVSGTTGLQKLTINTADGTFTGDVAKPGPGNKTLKLKGVLLQGSALGAGYFLNDPDSGHFVIGTP